MAFDDLFDIQKNMANRIAREVELDKAIDLMSIIQSLIPDKNGKIPIDSIILEARYFNLSEEDVLNYLQILRRNGSIKLLEGFVKI